MSLKLFLQSTFGTIRATHKIESEYEKLLADYNEYCEVDKSDELAEFIELENFVKSDQFAEVKNKIKNTKFKGSKEEELLKEFNKLSKNKNLKKYYQTEISSELKRFFEIDESDELKSYFELKKYVEDGEYKSAKHKSNSEKFKSSTEESILKEFKKLSKSRSIKTYLRLHDSSELKEQESFKNSEKLKRFNLLTDKHKSGNLEKDEKQEWKELRVDSEIKKHLKFINSSSYNLYLTTRENKILNRYNELMELINSNDFKNRVEYLKDAKKFEKTEAYKKHIQYQQLKSSENIKFYLKYENSSVLKNYEKMKSSKEKERYEELKTLSESDDFKQRVAYLKDDKKWEKTEEYEKLQQYTKKANLPHIVKYFEYKNNDKLNFFRNWELIFEDTFNSSKLDNSKWQLISPAATKTLGKNYSQPEDLQAFTAGENITTDGKTLKITTKMEKIKGMQWQLPFGFIEKEFDYSSGIINSGNSFNPKFGILEAKIKYSPQKNLVSAFYLIDEDNATQINLIETGKKNRVGMLKKNKGEIKETLEDIGGLKKNKFYIFKLEWDSNKISWYINNKLILEQNTDIPTTEMHLNSATIVIDEIKSGIPYNFEIDWVRFFQKKQK